MARRNFSKPTDELSPGLARLLRAHLRDEPSVRARRAMWREIDRSISAHVEPRFPVDQIDPEHAVVRTRTRTLIWVGLAVTATAAALLLALQPTVVGVSRPELPPTSAQDRADPAPAHGAASTRPTTAPPTTAPPSTTAPPTTTAPLTTSPARLPRRIDSARRPNSRVRVLRDSPSAESRNTGRAAGARTPIATRVPAALPAEATAPEGSASRLHEEAALLASARRALAQGEYATALQKIELHRRRFEEGLLSQEREVLRVQSLCAAGDPAKAAQSIAAFHRDYPKSPHASALDAACTR